MNTLIIDAILEASEDELREAWGDEEFERLAEQGRSIVDKALADVDSKNALEISDF